MPASPFNQLVTTMNETELRNESEYTFIDISSEKKRRYDFYTDGDVYYVTIHEPAWLAISSSGHRILDKMGRSHYIPNGWLHLQWEVHQDEPHFVR